MQSRVVAFGVCLSHSITVWSSSAAPSGKGGRGFRRCFGFAFESSLTFRFLTFDLAEPLAPFAAEGLVEDVGLPARLPPCAGLTARLPFSEVAEPPARGLVARPMPFAGIFGLMARCARADCPPYLGTLQTMESDVTVEPMLAVRVHGVRRVTDTGAAAEAQSIDATRRR